MIFVFVAGFGVVVDLDFVAVVDGHPGFGGSDGNSNEDAGVIVFVAHFVHDSNDAITEFGFCPVEEAHAAVSVDEAVFDGHVTGANVFPAIEILAVEELPPFGGSVAAGGQERVGEEEEGENFRRHICKATPPRRAGRHKNRRRISG